MLVQESDRSVAYLHPGSRHSMKDIHSIYDDATFRFIESIASQFTTPTKEAGTDAVADKDMGHGICMEKGCSRFATKDYNGHQHWACDRHFDKLHDEFEDEYR